MRALVLGEASQPGTSVYDRVKHSAAESHFLFHQVLDLPEALIAGRERLYLQYFYDWQAARPTAVDAAACVRAYEQPGAVRAGLNLYRAFDLDAADVRVALDSAGKLTVPCLGLYGDASLTHRDAVEEIGRDIAEVVNVEGIPDAAPVMREAERL